MSSRSPKSFILQNNSAVATAGPAKRSLHLTSPTFDNNESENFSSLPPALRISARLLRRYKKVIVDASELPPHNANHHSNPLSTDFLKPPRGISSPTTNAHTERRSESIAPREKRDFTTKTPHPAALERRKARDISAEAQAQIREFQALAQRLLEQREQQQQDISRELHDNIAQVLSAAAARISLAKDEPIPAWLRQELVDLRDQLKSALEDVRHLARDLRPSLLDHCGFAAALEKHADAFRERTTINLEVRLDHEAVSFLESGNLTHLFRLTQEALHNIEDHSGANRAWINLWQCDGTLQLEIGDDGCAFTPERVAEAQADGHLGLLGMRERAELLGGRFLLEATTGQGTVIRVTIPPPPPQNPSLNSPYETNLSPHH